LHTAGDALTLTGAEFDFDGGASPGGELGGADWANPTIDDNLSVTSWTLTTPLTIGDIDGDDSYFIQLQNTADNSANNAFYFLDGSADYIDLGDINILDGIDHMSIVMAVKMLDTGVQRLATKEDVWYLYHDGTNIVFAIHGGTTLTTAYTMGDNMVIGVVYSEGAETSQYVNGKQIATTAAGTALPSSAHELSIGARNSGGGGFIEQTHMQIAKFYLFNVALTEAEMQEYYAGTAIPYKYIGASETEQTSGTLTIGKAYRINNWISADDFTNVGGANVDGTEFVATGTTPTTWTNSSTVVPIGALIQLESPMVEAATWRDLSGNGYDGAVVSAISNGSGIAGTLVLDDGTTERITLVFGADGTLVSRTVAATTALLIDWTD